MGKRIALLALTLMLVSLAACTRNPQPVIEPTAVPTLPSTMTPSAPTSLPTETSAPPAPTTPADSSISAANAATLQNFQSVELPMDSTGLVWSLDGTKVVVTSYKGLMVVDARSFEILDQVTFPETESLVDVSPDGHSLATSVDFNTIAIRDISTDQVTTTITPGVQFVGAGFSPDGSQFVVASGEQWAAMIYDLPSGELVDTVTGFETAAPVYGVRMTPDEITLVWLARGTIQVEAIAGQTLGEAIHHEDFITAYSLSRSGKLLATAAAGTVNEVFTPLILFWDPTSGEKIGQIEMPSPVYSLEFSPDGTILAGTSDDQVLLVDVSGQTLVFSESAHPGGAWSARFSPNAEILATVGADKQLRFWKAE